MTRAAASIAEVVSSGLCIGCGLCESVTRGRVKMQMTDYGSLRPTPADQFTADEQAQLLRACPGVAVEPREQAGLAIDPIWGGHSTMQYAWAGESALRFAASTAGVLSALGGHLLTQGPARFILQVAPDPQQPLRNKWYMSETAGQVFARAGSRYAPTAPLAGLVQALEQQRPFAIIAKPCDLNAVHRYAQQDPRVDELCIARLTMVCGGQSRLTKSLRMLAEFDVAEHELSSFRYRGFGNPGRTRMETKNGAAFEKTYLQMWQDEGTWDLETRCKVCPDALGEASDIAVADVWPDANPTGEDAGLSGIIVRSNTGEALLTAAVAAGDVVLGEAITPRQFDAFQPHQVRKKQVLKARLDGLAATGLPVIQTPGLRLEELAEQTAPEVRQAEFEGTVKRVRGGKIREPLPRAEAANRTPKADTRTQAAYRRISKPRSTP